jgi:error-prone DNA polymerase
MIEGMARNGYDRAFAERCFRQIEGFGEYGFPESHAASFALLVYASSWLKAYYPDVFCAALLNAQPMGFYAPAQLVRDAAEHGVEVRAVDVNHSAFDATLEDDGRPARDHLHPRHGMMRGVVRARCAVRLGLRQVKGVSAGEMALVVERRGAGYDGVRDLWLRTGLPVATIERLADADAFRSVGLDRRAALWAARGLGRTGGDDRLPLFAAAGPMRESEPDVRLPPMPPGEHVVADYRFLSLSLKAHPVSFLRERLDRMGVVRAERLADMAVGRRVTVAGLVLVRQRPGSAKGVIFMTLEDETGVANAIVWPAVFERLRGIVIGARFITLTGRLQREAGVVHVVADEMSDGTPMLRALSDDGAVLDGLARVDEVRRPVPDGAERLPRALRPLPPALPLPAPGGPPRDPVAAETGHTLGRGAARVDRFMPKGRNFH